MPVLPAEELEKQRFNKDKERIEKTKKKEGKDEEESVYKTIVSLRKKIDILKKYEQEFLD